MWVIEESIEKDVFDVKDICARVLAITLSATLTTSIVRLENYCL